MHHGQLGAHIEVLEMDDLHTRVRSASDSAVDAKIAEIRTVFDIVGRGKDRISQDVTPDALRWSARVAAGLDQLASDFDLNGLTYYYRGLDGNENEELGASLIVGNSLLTARGIPASGEGDLKTCVAMLIMDRLGAGGSYTEFYAMDFAEDFILMGHDGPGHVGIAEGKPVLRGLGLYHGKRGYGLSVQMQVKTGPITILGMTQTADGRLKMLAAQGESLPGPTLQIGNTNSRLKFGLDPATFMSCWCEHGPTHHVALGVGHQLGRIAKLARLLNLELAVVE
jgi:L-arabinose isomerase